MSAPMSHLGSYRGQHAIDRAMERYGVALSPRDIEALEARIVARRSVLIARNADGTERHLVEAEGVQLVALFVPLTKQIVTFLRRTMVEYLKSGDAPRRRRRR